MSGLYTSTFDNVLHFENIILWINVQLFYVVENKLVFYYMVYYVLTKHDVKSKYHQKPT